jgi:hypothetical protein
MACVACKRDKEIAARGLCRACYQRWYKTGSTEYQRWGKISVCEIVGCGEPVVSGGLCDKHRKRLERHGHTEETRPDSWGAIEKHPLRNAWRWLQRHSSKQPVRPEWIRDFLQFVADVGERPSAKHKLFAADDAKPIGPGNFVWKRAITERVAGEDEQTYRSRRARVYRALKEEKFRGYDLKKRFGLSHDDYNAMSAEAEHRCEICGQEETTKIRERVLRLAVDHCHTTGKVRGLLCMSCNRGLGYFRDDPEFLRRAIAYLGRKRST